MYLNKHKFKVIYAAFNAILFYLKQYQKFVTVCKVDKKFIKIPHIIY